MKIIQLITEAELINTSSYQFKPTGVQKLNKYVDTSSELIQNCINICMHLPVTLI